MDILAPLIILATIIFALWVEWSTRRVGIGPIPMAPHQRAVLIKALQTHRPARDDITILELGSGWGGTVAALSRALPYAHIIGYELFLPAWGVARLRFLGTKNIAVHRADFFIRPLPATDIVVCYLSFALTARLGPKLLADLPPGTIIISASFPIPDWQAIDTIPIPGPIQAPIYVYRV